jgi:hypothetical protein
MIFDCLPIKEIDRPVHPVIKFSIFLSSVNVSLKLSQLGNDIIRVIYR